MRITDKYVFFWSGIYSNWDPSPFQIDGVWYNCSEQYYMTEKARFFGDQAIAARILAAVDPADQKRYGRQVSGFDEKRWNVVARDVMYKGVYAKFSQNPDIKAEMMSTGDRLFVEASPRDCIWGIGLAKENDACLDPRNWLGTNWLGDVLTRVRNNIRGNNESPS